MRMPKMVVCGKRRMVTHVKRKEQSRKMKVSKKVSNWIEYFCNIYRDLVSLFVTPPGGDTPADADDQKVRSVEDDPVNHPAHYTRGGIECIDAIKASMSPAEFRGFLKGNAMKYIWRYDAKGKPVEDLDKAMWYLTRLRNEIKP